MQRNKNIDYDADDIYSDDGDFEEQGGEEYTAEDRANFTNLAPVVRAELEEAGIQASTSQIEDALWHYYWDVGKSVAYLKNSRTPRQPQEQSSAAGKKEKAKSKFDEAQQKSAEAAGKCHAPFSFCFGLDMYTMRWRVSCTDSTGGPTILHRRGRRPLTACWQAWRCSLESVL